MLRRTTVSAEDAIERSKQIYAPRGGRFRQQPPRWRMPNGGRVTFGYLETIDDANGYQGRNVTDVWIEEAGQYPNPGPIDRLFGILRSAASVPIQMVLTANPGGAGQHWIRYRYHLHPFPRHPLILRRRLPDGSEHKVAVIPSRIGDNKILLANDPSYVSRLHLVGSAQLVKAWLEGDWTAIEGAFFQEWSERQHVITPFDIPRHWLRFRSGDWGSASPFSFGWWAVCSDDYELPQRSDSTDRRVIPRGALVRYREWYGASAKGEGLKLTAEQVADGIISRERGDPKLAYGVLDTANFSEQPHQWGGGPSIAERINDKLIKAGVAAFHTADRTRVRRVVGDAAKSGPMGGWDVLRSRLVGSAKRRDDGTIDWATGSPMLYVVDACKDLIRTLPVMQHDMVRSEDIDTNSEDHAVDECVIGSTLIDTDRGLSPISLIKVGDRVFTREGIQSVDAVFSVGVRPVFQLLCSGGQKLIATGNHPIFVDKFGFVPLANLRYGDILRTCIRPSLARQFRNFVESAIISAVDTFRIKASGFTSSYGSILTDLCRPAVMFITRTMTDQTMILATSNASVSENISETVTGRKVGSELANIFQKRELQPLNGTDQTKDDSGTLSIIKNIVQRLFIRGNRKNATIAERDLMLSPVAAFAPMLANQRGEEPQESMTLDGYVNRAGQSFRSIDIQNSGSVQSNALRAEATSVLKCISHALNVARNVWRRTGAQSSVPVRVVSVTPVGMQRVYNLTVADDREYFANGLLTHNCRYACMSRPWVKVLPGPERPKDGYSPQSEVVNDTDSILLL